MKTIMDVINEFKGEWPYAGDFMVCYAAGVGYFYLPFDSSTLCEHVCTREQFKYTVKKCETNFGTSKTIVECKAMKEIDWNKAPDGATHYDTSPDVHPWIMEGDTFTNYWSGWNWLVFQKRPSKESFIPRPKPQTKPIYTQAMADNGELPSAGMECVLFDATSKWVHCEVTYISEWVAVLKQYEDGYGKGVEVSRDVWDLKIKPLTPPITLEDGKAYSFEYLSHGLGTGYYNSNSDQFVNINFDLNARFCTNITLLTPEVK